MKCTPGYSVPGRVPEIWLTRTPAIPLGTTTMLKLTRNGSQAMIASFFAVDQRTGLGAGSFSAAPRASNLR